MMLLKVLIVFVSIVTLPYVFCQADLEHSYTIDQMPLEDKALFLADSLVQHPAFFKKLIKAGEAAQPLLGVGGDDPKVSFLVNIWLDKLPAILNSPDTATILTILADELHRINVSDVTTRAQNKNLETNSTEYQDMMADAITTRLNKLRAGRRIATYRSARESFPLAGNNVDAACYDDVMNFVDAVHSVQYPPRQDLNFSSVPWALKMLDSFGKPPSAILEGDLDWEGSVAECRGVHAHLDTGVIVGNRALTSPVNFHGRYCHVTLNITNYPFIPEMDISNVDDLRWGICVPDTCSSKDVTQLLHMDILKRMKLDAESVRCYDKNEQIEVKQPHSSSKPPSVASGPDDFFKTCLGNNAGLSQDKWKHCFFSKFDSDNNGAISKDEFKSKYIKLQLINSDNVDRFFVMLDTNKNLVIDATDLGYYFVFFDDNNDGQVNFSEYSINGESLFS